MTDTTAIEALARRHPSVGIDSNVLICLLEDAGALGDTAAVLIDAVADGTLRGVLATLGLAELLVGPAGAGDPALLERYVEEITTIDGLAIRPLTVDVAVSAALRRAIDGVGLADAIHLATARDAGATAFVTNDRRVRTTDPRLEIVRLDELAE